MQDKLRQSTIYPEFQRKNRENDGKDNAERDNG